MRSLKATTICTSSGPIDSISTLIREKYESFFFGLESGSVGRPRRRAGRRFAGHSKFDPSDIETSSVIVESGDARQRDV